MAGARPPLATTLAFAPLARRVAGRRAAVSGTRSSSLPVAGNPGADDVQHHFCFALLLGSFVLGFSLERWSSLGDNVVMHSSVSQPEECTDCF
jgi:hypothetical protein